jgi:tRNA A-37 threonylcarbamoyl transferase component Bud32
MAAPTRRSRRITSFHFPPGKRLAGKYVVQERMGGGWQGEVYKLVEDQTGIKRAAKFFFPHRNVRNRALHFYARKLDKLRHCPIVIQYHTVETIEYRGRPVHFLVSEFVEGEQMSAFLARQPGKRLAPFEALHVLYALASGMEAIHKANEYHGDLHPHNIIIKRRGIGFEVKLIDMFHWGAPSSANIREDVIDLVHLLYQLVGGRKWYAFQREELKGICCGLKRSMITRKFKTAGALREYLESMSWNEEPWRTQA